MATIAIDVFGGIRPRLSRRLGENPTASRAENTKLWHGTIAPWRQPRLVADSGECIRSLFVDGCSILTDSNPCANFATGSGCNRVFATDLCGFPHPMTARLPLACSLGIVKPDWERLGVPQPDAVAFGVPALAPPIVAPSMEQGFQRAREHRDYVITYVNQFGEEGEPSPSSPNAGDADIDAPATITIGPRPHPDQLYNVVAIRVYRLFSGNTDGAYMGKEEDPQYLFVAEIDLDGVQWDQVITYQDDGDAANLLEPAPMNCVNVPPDCLHGIIELESGPLVAFEGKNLWFSEPFQYHNWSCNLNFDYEIKGIAEVSGVIYVVTDGHPYSVSSRSTEEGCSCCRQVFKHPEPAPMVSDRRGLVKTANGVIYPSNDGLVRLTGNSMSLVTHSEIAEDDWQTFHPWELKGAGWNGRYMGFGPRSFIFDYTDGIYADGDVGAQSRMTTLSYQPDATWSDSRGDVYLAFGTEVRKWDDAADFERYTWQSKLHQSHARNNWSAARLFFEDGGAMVSMSNPVTFELLDGRDKVLHSVRVHNEEPFRLCAGIRDRAVQVRVSGTTEIAAIVLATSIRELTLSSMRR